MDLSTELRDFLVAKRAAVQPETAGVQPFGGQRRVQGLRREEVAQLAGISVDYYTRLERGRFKGVSPAVLEAVGRALQLDEVEYEHLQNLVDRSHSPRPRRRPVAPRHVPTELQSVLDAITLPAFIQNEWFDVLAANTIGHAIYPLTEEDHGTPGVPNLARFFFLNPRADDFYLDRDRVARNTVAMLRAAVGRHPDDQDLIALIGLLSTRSEEFRRLWADQHVVRYRSGGKRYNHPLAGEIEFTYQTLEFPAHPGLTLLVYGVQPDSLTEQAVRFLASWAPATAGSQHSDAPS